MSKRLVGWGLILFTALALAGFIAIQFVPVERTNPPLLGEPPWDSPETRALAKRACFDCHSNETVWPLYSRVAPVSWLIVRHVNDGRRALNFSEWRGGEEADEVISVIQNGQMPLPNYLFLHPEASLSPVAKAALIDGLRATIAHSGSGTETEQGETNAADREGMESWEEGEEDD